MAAINSPRPQPRRWTRTIIIAAVIGGVAIVFFAAVQLHRRAEKRAVDEFLSRQEIITGQAAGELTRFFSHRLRALDLVQEQLFGQTAFLIGRLRQVFNQFEGFHTILYADSEGYVRFGYPVDLYRGARVTDFPILSADFAAIQQTARGRVSGEKLREGEKLLIPLISPIFLQGEFNGAVLGLVDTGALGRSFLLPLTFGKGSASFLYEADYGFLYRTSPPAPRVSEGEEAPAVSLPPELRSLAAEARSGSTLSRWEDSPAAVSIRPVKVNRVAVGVAVFEIPIDGETGVLRETYADLAAFFAEEVNRKLNVADDISDPQRLTARLEDFWRVVPAEIDVTILSKENIGFRVVAASKKEKIGRFLTIDDLPCLECFPNKTVTQLVTRQGPEGRVPEAVQTAVPITVTDRLWSVIVVTPVSLVLGTVRGWIYQSWGIAGLVVLFILTAGVLLIIDQNRRTRERVRHLQERLRLEEEIVQAKNQLQEIFDGIGAGIILLNREGSLMRVNYTVIDWIDRPPGELIGASYREIFPEEGWPVIEAALQKPEPGEARIVPWFEGRVFEMSAYPISGKEGPAGQLIITLQDVTERRRVRERLRVAEKLAATSTLVAGVAHEIKNPLNSMALSLGNLSYLLERLQDETAKAKGTSYINRLKEDVSRLTDLINRFMAVARPIPEERRKVSLSKLARSLAEAFADQAKAAGVDIRLEAKRVSSLLLEPEETERAVRNLIVNGLEAMAGGGTLTIRTGASDGLAFLEIEDTGPGIPPEVADKMFDIFFSTKEGGTGLGLSIVHRAVEGQGGRIEVTSKPGQGSRFKIMFPQTTDLKRRPAK